MELNKKKSLNSLRGKWGKKKFTIIILLNLEHEFSLSLFVIFQKLEFCSKFVVVVCSQNKILGQTK